MKLLYTLIILFVVCSTPVAAEDMSITFNAGTTFKRIGYGYANPSNDMLAVGFRYYINENVFTAINLTSWNDGIQYSKKGDILSVNIGYRTSGKLFFETSLGIGYLDTPDGFIETVDEKRVERGYQTKHRQFELNFAIGYKFTGTFNGLLGWTHLSNCYTICNLDDSYDPNPGRDFIRIGFEQRF